MYPRTNYEMTQAQCDALLAACKPTPVMFASGGVPIGGSQQENANAAWADLGRQMGFDHMTVQPVSGKGMRFFTAVPSETQEQQQTRIARQAEEKRHAEILVLNTEIADRQKRLQELGA